MATLQIEAEWNVLLTEYADAGMQCVLARHRVERATTEVLIAEYAKASERWIDIVLRTSDFVRDCPA